MKKSIIPAFGVFLRRLPDLLNQLLLLGHFFALGRTNIRLIDMFRMLARALMAETDLFNFAAMR
jgi:hypothetical protein